MKSFSIDGAVRRVGSKSDTAWKAQRDLVMRIAGIDPNPQKAGEVLAGPKGYWRPCILPRMKEAM